MGLTMLPPFETISAALREEDLGEWQDPGTRPLADGLYLRKNGPSLAFARFSLGSWRSDIAGFHVASRQNLPWTGRLSAEVLLPCTETTPETIHSIVRTAEPNESDHSAQQTGNATPLDLAGAFQEDLF